MIEKGRVGGGRWASGTLHLPHRLLTSASTARVLSAPGECFVIPILAALAIWLTVSRCLTIACCSFWVRQGSNWMRPLRARDPSKVMLKAGCWTSQVTQDHNTSSFGPYFVSQSHPSQCLVPMRQLQSTLASIFAS